MADDPDAVAAEIVHLEAEPRQRVAAGQQRLALGRRQFEHDRNQQPLALERTLGEPLHEALEQHPLVRHVLIDDRNPLVVDRDDEGVAKLPQRDERPHARAFGTLTCVALTVRAVNLRCL